MHIIGYENIQKLFEKLVKNEALSNSYIFFGEPQVGKYTFALSLASFIENGFFEESGEAGSNKILTDALIIKPTDGSIGIDEVRKIKYFLSQKPIKSSRRMVIIDDAHLLTAQAQHSALKISEEPPLNSLLILITPTVNSLIPTLQSRFQKIHCPRQKSLDIEKLLIKDYGLDKSKAESLALISLGRMGRAIDLVSNESKKELYKRTLSLLKKDLQKRQVIEELIEKEESVEDFFTEIIAELAKDPIKNYDTLSTITKRMTLMAQFSTNRRLQIESAIWNI